MLARTCLPAAVLGFVAPTTALASRGPCGRRPGVLPGGVVEHQVDAEADSAPAQGGREVAEAVAVPEVAAAAREGVPAGVEFGLLAAVPTVVTAAVRPPTPEDSGRSRLP